MGLFGTLGKLVGGAGGFLLGGPAGAAAGAGILGGIGGGIDSDKKAKKFNQQATALHAERWKAGAPFRSRLTELALNLPSEREDLSALFADPGNPYARVVPRGPAPPGGGSAPIVPSRPRGMGLSGLASRAFADPRVAERTERTRTMARRVFR